MRDNEQSGRQTADGGPVVVCGHSKVLTALLRTLSARSGAQAHLLAGPSSVGKTAAALFVAQWALCAEGGPAGRPCGRCRACRLVASGAHPDLCLLEAPLRIEPVRELQRRLSLAPMEGRRHVAILPDVDTASAGASNSLLKTLEEPPAESLLLLTAADLSAVLPTVRSRCQVHHLRPLAAGEAAAALAEQWGAPPERADLLARLAGGRLGWALRAMADAELLERRALWLHRLETVLSSDTASRLETTEGWGKDRDAFAEGLAAWRTWWRDVMLVQHHLESNVVNCDRLESLREAASRYSVSRTVRALRDVDSALAGLRGNASGDLTATLIALELPA